MIFGVANIQLQTLQFNATTQRQTGAMTGGSILAFINLHLTATTEVITCRDIDGRTETDVGTDGKVLDEFVVPEGYLMLNGDLNSSESLVVGELVPESYVTGKASIVLYPFSLFGRSADYLKK